MKAEILKIAGVKSEKEFYKKYPTEEAFMKAHSKEFRKAKIGKAVPKAQDAYLDFMKDKQNCRGASWKPGCGGSGSGGEAGVGAGEYNKPEWQEISNIKSGYFDKDQIKQIKKDYAAIKEKYPNLDLNTYTAAVRDASRSNIKFANPDYAKYTDPQTGKMLPNYADMKIEPYFRFYREKFPTQAKISPEDVLGVWGSMPGGYANYQKYADLGYTPPKQKQGGQMHKLQQLTDFGNPPVAQVGTFIGGGAPDTMPNFINYKDIYNTYDKIVTGMTDAERAAMASKQAQDKSQGPDISGMLTQLGNAISGDKTAKKGKKVPKYQVSGPPLADAPEGMVWDESLQQYVQDTGYQAPPKFQLNPNLSVGTPKTGPGTGVNPSTSTDTSKGKDFDFGKYLGAAGKLYEGFRALNEEKKTRRRAEATAQAASSRPEQIRRRYVRPEDALVQPDQMFPTYGVGTNYLAKDGTTISQIGGNPTEIQNMYNPGTLYSDLGFEPMSESDIVKQYRHGGYHRMQGGGGLPWDAIGQFGSGIVGAATGSNAGGSIGGTIGGTVGSIFGPAGQAIGNIAGTFIGGALDTNKRRTEAANKKTRSNLERASLASGVKAIQASNNMYMEEGGWVSHDWQPQVITQFGEHSMHDLLKRDPMMDTLRTGGNITQNNIYPTDQYALGGELKTTWGGYAEPISYNPYMPGTGETVMFRGKSHEEGDGNGHTGIGVKYGDGGMTDYAEFGSRDADADVEVERGEPATEMVDPKTGEKNMVVFGNLKIPNIFLDQIGDKNAKGKKFKNYVADLGKDEAKQNKIIEKATDELNNLEVYTPFDKLTHDALQATIQGANMKLKEAALRKSNASSVQDAINQTAEEYGIDADALAKGKYKIDKEAMKQQAKFGKEILRAQTGVKYAVYDDQGKITHYVDEQGNKINETANTSSSTPNIDINSSDIAKTEYLDDLYKEAKKKKKGDAVEFFQKEFNRLYPDVATKVILNYPTVTGKAKSKYKIKSIDKLKQQSPEVILDTNVDKKFGPRTEAYKVQINRLKSPPPPLIRPKIQAPNLKINIPNIPQGITPTGAIPKPPKPPFDWIPYANQALEYLRPTDQEEFDYSQVYPEMMALAMNQLEPVQAQLYRPDLGIPMDISLQDQLNANQADFNALQRQTGYNPEALAALAAQKYAANSKVLADQFRLNQAEKQRVYEGNRALLNDAQLKNLGILDTQMVRQEEAKSRTKQQALEAMKSVADKIAKNKLENRTLGIYENLYKYRFDPSGRAINMNPLAQFSLSGSGSSSLSAPEGYEYETILRKKKKDDDTGRNGKIVKAIKNL